MSDNSSPKIVLQGDLAFVKVDDATLKLTVQNQALIEPGKTVVLAKGEKTGHQHVVEQTTGLAVGRSQYWPGIPTDVTIIVAGDEGSQVVHDEHQAALLEPGAVYFVSQQRQFVPPSPGTEMSRAEFRARYD